MPIFSGHRGVCAIILLKKKHHKLVEDCLFLPPTLSLSLALSLSLPLAQPSQAVQERQATGCKAERVLRGSGGL